MQIVRWMATRLGRVAFGFLALGALSQPIRLAMPPPPLPPPPTVEVPAAAAPERASRQWTLEVDEATLGGHLNAWAADQALVRTPLGAARLEQLRVQLYDEGLVL